MKVDVEEKVNMIFLPPFLRCTFSPQEPSESNDQANSRVQQKSCSKHCDSDDETFFFELANFKLIFSKELLKAKAPHELIV
jgi:hypothetical protein